MNLFNTIKKLVSEKQGNIAVTFGFALIPVMMAIGAAVDYSKLSNLQTKVSHATDAALLAAVSSVIDHVDLENEEAVLVELNSEFEPFFLANMGPISSYEYNGYSIGYNADNSTASVDVEVDYKTSMLGIGGFDKLNADVHATADITMKAGGAFSMFLVLDRSGSMSWDSGTTVSTTSKGKGKKKKKKKRKLSKMEALQIAVNQMITELKASDVEKKYIRMGAVSYNSYTWGEQPLTWDLERVNNYVQDMSAYGGTDSSGAVNKASYKLNLPIEINEHKQKSGQKPKLVMVFMTDGDNNYSSADRATLSTCNAAKARGIEIYTVAFQAPAKGQALLSACASSSSHDFEPENSQDLIDAFSEIGTKVGEKLVLYR